MRSRGSRLELPKKPRGPLGAGHCLHLVKGEDRAADYEVVPDFLECL